MSAKASTGNNSGNVTPDNTRCANPHNQSGATTLAEFATQQHQYMQQHQLGLVTADTVRPIPISYTPYQLTQTQWQQAHSAAHLLTRIAVAAANDLPALLEFTQELAASRSVPGIIWRLLAEQTTRDATQHNVVLTRHDLLLSQGGQWRWVESNPIAAGMGPLNAAVLTMLQTPTPRPVQLTAPVQLAPNDAITAQAAALMDAATACYAQYRHQGGSAKAVAYMVVEGNEDNIPDQALLQSAMRQYATHIPVHRITVAALAQLVIDADGYVYNADGDVLCLVYWRTGYNTQPELDTEFWQQRQRLESCTLAQCPTLAFQLTGSKWFQHKVSRAVHSNNAHQPPLPTFLSSLRTAEWQQLASLCVDSHAAVTLSHTDASALITQGYWFKTQGEGGGNVRRGAAALAALHNSLDAGDLLMAPIDVAVRQEPIWTLRDGSLTASRGHISELGLFVAGRTLQDAGYLCRTKPQHNDEGGVHRGGAVLDTITVAPNRP